jgi:archaellum component FlaC
MSDNDIREIRKDIADIKKSVSKMDDHITFIDSVYNTMSPMLNFLTMRYNNEVSPHQTLQQDEYQMLEHSDIISESEHGERKHEHNIVRRKKGVPILPVIAGVGVGALAVIIVFTTRKS